MSKLIGNTPMIKINYKLNDKLDSVYTKLEYYNLTGSIKDRMVQYIIESAYQKGLLKSNQVIVEATSGNTGISLAALGSRYHNPVYIFMPDWCSSERLQLIKSYGATVFLVSKEEGGFKECIKRASRLALEEGAFRPNQFSNIDNVKAHYNSTAKEIIDSLIKVDGFVSGIGTGGTLMGIGSFLKNINNNTLVVALEPKKMAILSGSKQLENHLIEGIGDDFIPDLVNEKIIDDIYLVDDIDAVNMSRLLAMKLGLGVGISSGANFLASIMLKEKLKGRVVTVFPDDNKKYLSTVLTNDLDDNPNLLSNKIELISYEEIY